MYRKTLPIMEGSTRKESIMTNTTVSNEQIMEVRNVLKSNPLTPDLLEVFSKPVLTEVARIMDADVVATGKKGAIKGDYITGLISLVEEIRANKKKKKKEKEEMTKPSNHTFTQEQLQDIIDRATNQAVQEAVASESAKYEAKIEQLLQQNAALAEQLTSNPEPKKEEPKKLEVDVSVVYDSLQAEAQKLLAEASDAIKEKNFDLYNKLMKDYGKVNSKAYDLGEQHKEKIFTVERSKRVMDDTRASIAKGLHQSAEVTNKYGHKGVDSLVSLANDILNGAVVVAKTGIDLTGKVGHTGVDLASDSLHAAGDFVQKK
jgi:hypothetical protein